MDAVYFLVQQMMFFSIPLLIVALGGMFSERSGVVNIALEGILVAGAFTSILVINALQAGMSGQGLLLLAILVAVVTGALFSLLHAYAAISLRSDQTISGTALNMIAPASAIYLARMIQPNGVQQIEFTNTFRIAKVPLLGDIPLLGWLFRWDTEEEAKTNILIFVTPRIVSTMEDADEVRAGLEAKTGLDQVLAPVPAEPAPQD